MTQIIENRERLKLSPLLAEWTKKVKVGAVVVINDAGGGLHGMTFERLNARKNKGAAWGRV